MKKALVFFSLLCSVNLGAMDWSNSSFTKAEKEKRSSYNGQFKLTESSSELYTQAMCTPKKKEKRPVDKFKNLCKTFMYYQLITHPDVRSLKQDELNSFFMTLNLSSREISNLKDFLKQAVLAFSLRTGKKPNQKALEGFSVHIIDLSKNKLSALPNGFKELAQCVKLIDVSDNKFKEVPPQLEFCNNLTFLNIAGNGIKSVPDWTDKFKVELATEKTNKNDKKSGIFKKTWQ